MISVKSDMHQNQPRPFEFRDAHQRLGEIVIAGHLQVRGYRRVVTTVRVVWR
jgi:hypothetical protein